MKRLGGYVLSAGIIAALGGATACEHNDQSMYLSHVQAPPDDCIYKPDPTAPFISSGAADIALASSYTAVFLAGNQLLARGEKVTVRAESARITVKGAVVSVSFADGTPWPGGDATRDFTTLTSSTIGPDTSSTATFGVVPLTLLDPKTIEVLRGMLPNRSATRTIVAKVKAFGVTLGGQDIESNEFEFPIVVTNGGLITFPKEADDPATPGPDCLLPRAGGQTSAAKKVCYFGQDQVVDCRDCFGLSICAAP